MVSSSSCAQLCWLHHSSPWSSQTTRRTALVLTSTRPTPSSLFTGRVVACATTHGIHKKRAKRAKRNPHRCESIRSGVFDASLCLLCWPLNGCSFQDALRSFFQPIKNDDPRLDFYTMYKREATEYNTDYVKKYDEDLNTTLIFVRRLLCALVGYLTWSRRRVFSLPSAQHSSLTPIPSSSLTRTTNP